MPWDIKPRYSSRFSIFPLHPSRSAQPDTAYSSCFPSGSPPFAAAAHSLNKSVSRRGFRLFGNSRCSDFACARLTPRYMFVPPSNRLMFRVDSCFMPFDYIFSRLITIAATKRCAFVTITQAELSISVASEMLENVWGVRNNTVFFFRVERR